MWLGPWHKETIQAGNPVVLHCHRRMNIANTSNFVLPLDIVAEEGPRRPCCEKSTVLLKSRSPVAICITVCITSEKRSAFLKCWLLGGYVESMINIKHIIKQKKWET